MRQTGCPACGGLMVTTTTGAQCPSCGWRSRPIPEAIQKFLVAVGELTERLTIEELGADVAGLVCLFTNNVLGAIAAEGQLGVKQSLIILAHVATKMANNTELQKLVVAAHNAYHRGETPTTVSMN